MENVVPFGKYKSQPLGVLAADSDYCEWLLNQAWFAERYPSVYTLVINNFGEPSETPEHNRLQLRFLDQDFCLRCVAAFLTRVVGLGAEFRKKYWLVSPPEFEVAGADASIRMGYWQFKREEADTTFRSWLGSKFDTEMQAAKYCQHPQQLTMDQVQTLYADDSDCFNYRVVSETVYFDYQPLGNLIVECKPSLGDDYPAVLRFIKNLSGSRYRALIVERCHFRGGTVDDVRTFFAGSDVVMLLVDEIERTAPLPTCTYTNLPNPLAIAPS